MKRGLFLICILSAFANHARAQQLSIKGSLFGVPLGDFGTYFCHFGAEYRIPDSRNSIELSYSIAGWGGIVSDAPEPKRHWGTVAFQHYLGKKEFRNSAFISFFTEAGNRRILPGKVGINGDSALNNQHAGEINPGVSFGKNFRLGKRWFIQTQLGPKLLFARYTDTYYHNLTHSYTEQKHNEISAGARFHFSFCYQI